MRVLDLAALPHQGIDAHGLLAMVVEGDVDLAEHGRQIDRGDI